MLTMCHKCAKHENLRHKDDLPVRLRNTGKQLQVNKLVGFLGWHCHISHVSNIFTMGEGL